MVNMVKLFNHGYPSKVLKPFNGSFSQNLFNCVMLVIKQWLKYSSMVIIPRWLNTGYCLIDSRYWFERWLVVNTVELLVLYGG